MTKIENVYYWKDVRCGYYERSENDVYINGSAVVKVCRFETKVNSSDNWGNLTLIYLLGNIGHGINGTDGITVVTGLSPEEVIKKIEGGAK